MHEGGEGWFQGGRFSSVIMAWVPNLDLKSWTFEQREKYLSYEHFPSIRVNVKKLWQAERFKTSVKGLASQPLVPRYSNGWEANPLRQKFWISQLATISSRSPWLMEMEGNEFNVVFGNFERARGVQDILHNNTFTRLFETNDTMLQPFPTIDEHFLTLLI